MCKRLSAVALVVLVGGASVGAAPEVIYSTIEGVKDGVPGTADLRFEGFGVPWGSADGSRWGMWARNGDASTARDGMYLTGEGVVGTLRIQEGVTVVHEGRVPEGLNDQRIGVLNDGTFGVALNLSGDVANDQVGVIGNAGGSLSVVVREGDDIGGPGGARMGSNMSDAGVTKLDMVSPAQLAVRAVNLAGTIASEDAVLLRQNGVGVVAQKGVTVPENQFTGIQTVMSFEAGRYFVSGSGGSSLYVAQLNGPAATSQVLCVNNRVQIQEGATLAGMSSPVLRIINARMEANGDWFARGENQNGEAWVVRNGIVVARVGDAMGGEAGEMWSSAPWDVLNGDTFFAATGNGKGDFVIGGFTDLEDGTRNAAWVVNNSVVAARRGDGVDLDGDGAADDAFIEFTGLSGATLNGKADGAFLSDDGWLYFIADLRDGEGELIGEAFLRTRVTASVPPCEADVNGDAIVTGADLSVLLSSFGSAQPAGTNGDLNGDGMVDGRDLSVLLARFGEECG